MVSDFVLGNFIAPANYQQTPQCSCILVLKGAQNKYENSG